MKQELRKGPCYSWSKGRGLEGARRVQEARPHESPEENPIIQLRTDMTVLKRCQKRKKSQGSGRGYMNSIPVK